MPVHVVDLSGQNKSAKGQTYRRLNPKCAMIDDCLRMEIKIKTHQHHTPHPGVGQADWRWTW